MRFRHIVDNARYQLNRVINDRPELSVIPDDPLDILAVSTLPPNLSAVKEVLERIEVLRFQRTVSGLARHSMRDFKRLKECYRREASHALAHSLMPHVRLEEELRDTGRYYADPDTVLHGELYFIKGKTTA